MNKKTWNPNRLILLKDVCKIKIVYFPQKKYCKKT